MQKQQAANNLSQRSPTDSNLGQQSQRTPSAPQREHASSREQPFYNAKTTSSDPRQQSQPAISANPIRTAARARKLPRTVILQRKNDLTNLRRRNLRNHLKTKGARTYPPPRCSESTQAPANTDFHNAKSFPMTPAN